MEQWNNTHKLRKRNIIEILFLDKKNYNKEIINLFDAE